MNLPMPAARKNGACSFAATEFVKLPKSARAAKMATVTEGDQHSIDQNESIQRNVQYVNEEEEDVGNGEDSQLDNFMEDDDEEVVINDGADEVNEFQNLAYAMPMNEFNNFLDNDDPLAFDPVNNILPIFHHAASEDVVYTDPTKPVKLVGKYLIGGELGEGSYGKVKEALDTETLVRRAAKVLRQKKLRKIPSGEQNVQREIALHRQLKHPAVVMLVDVLRIGSTRPESAVGSASIPHADAGTNNSLGHFASSTLSGDEKIYVIMEYCVTSLQKVLDEMPGHRIAEPDAHRYFCQVVDGLHYLHSRGVIHKDIKPGNLLLSNESRIKICDFGVAEKLDGYTSQDLITGSQGSPIVQPPEIANGTTPIHGFKLDVWSAGVTLYAMIAGCYPFEGENIYQVFQATARGIFIMPDVDVSLQGLIRGMLTYDPESRLSLGDVCAHDWCRRRHLFAGYPVPISVDQFDRSSAVLQALAVCGCPTVGVRVLGQEEPATSRFTLQQEIPPAQSGGILDYSHTLSSAAATSPIASRSRRRSHRTDKMFRRMCTQS